MILYNFLLEPITQTISLEIEFVINLKAEPESRRHIEIVPEPEYGIRFEWPNHSSMICCATLYVRFLFQYKQLVASNKWTAIVYIISLIKVRIYIALLS